MALTLSPALVPELATTGLPGGTRRTSVDLITKGPALRTLPDEVYNSVVCVFPRDNQNKLSSTIDIANLQWYGRWLDRQFKNVPPSIAHSLVSFPHIFQEVAEFAGAGCSLEETATRLLELDLIRSGDYDGRQVARTIVFAILGWQTMLYEPAFQTCPPQQLAIADVLDGHFGQAFMKIKQDQSRVSDRLSDFLLGFGLMLPREDLCVSEDPEDCHAFESVAIIHPAEFNVALLQSLARVNIKWIDVMAPHLEFDKATNTLFLFRYPSFCLANIPSKEFYNGVIYGCAAQSDDNENWASEMEVTQLLHEILLSYRLLFGQSKDSRRLFQPMDVFKGEPPEAHDPLLEQLCNSKSVMLPSSCKEREFYRLRRDFPILRSKIASLQQQMQNLKPRGWREIWKDKRDSAQWYTFWAVMIFGATGIVLAAIQVVLQAAQLGGH